MTFPPKVLTLKSGAGLPIGGRGEANAGVAASARTATALASLFKAIIFVPPRRKLLQPASAIKRANGRGPHAPGRAPVVSRRTGRPRRPPRRAASPERRAAYRS